MPEKKGRTVKSQQDPAICCPAECNRHTQVCVQVCRERQPDKHQESREILKLLPRDGMWRISSREKCQMFIL